jgi:hypothetical protein
MAKGHRRSERARPHLQAVFFCEKVLTEADNVTSAIRIVDTINLTITAGKPKRGMALLLPLALLVMVKAGDARGEKELQVRSVGPSGKAYKAGTWKFTLAGPPEGGANLRADQVQLKWDKEGLYWFEILLDGTLFARAPLRVNIVKADPQAQMPAP